MPAGYFIALDALAGLDGRNQADPPLSPPLASAPALPVTYGTFSALQPARSPATNDGYPIRDWQPDYLDRIIITISNANFGTVAGVVERTLTIWNRYTGGKSVTAQGAVGASGISIIGWPALPFTIAATEERTWPLQATPEGEPVIAGYLTFTIGGEELETADLAGIRAIIFPHSPNWSQPVEVDRGYADTIGDTISLAEERESHGDVPLLDARFTVLAIDRDEASSLARTLERTRALPVGLPIWTEAVSLTSAASVNDTTLAVTSTLKRKFTTVRPFVLLWQDWRTWAIVEVTAIAANQLTLTAGLLAGWPAGTRVVPVRFGNLAFGGDQALPTDRMRQFAVDFAEKPLG
jgi:hypothetical protein